MNITRNATQLGQYSLVGMFRASVGCSEINATILHDCVCIMGNTIVKFSQKSSPFVSMWTLYDLAHLKKLVHHHSVFFPLTMLASCPMAGTWCHVATNSESRARPVAPAKLAVMVLDTCWMRDELLVDL